MTELPGVCLEVRASTLQKRTGGVLFHTRDWRQEFLHRWHGLRVGLEGRRGKAQEWCKKLWMEVQMWKSQGMWKNGLIVEKPLEKGKSQQSRPEIAHPGWSEEQHAVAIGVEAVAVADGVVVGGQDGPQAAVGGGVSSPFPVVHTVREGGDQHEEGGFGEVEVGEQAVDDAEPVAGREEDGGRAGVGFEVEWAG
jgi:hypothetical protein